MKKTCDNCDNYCIRTLDLVPMYHCTEWEYGENPVVEEPMKNNGKDCSLWMEKIQLFKKSRGY
jgi:hypothetical protein